MRFPEIHLQTNFKEPLTVVAGNKLGRQSMVMEFMSSLGHRRIIPEAQMNSACLLKVSK